MKRKSLLLSVILCLLITVSAAFPVTASAQEDGGNIISQEQDEQDSGDEEGGETQEPEKPELSETNVKGLEDVLNTSKELELTVDITVSPANPERKVKLQRYVSEKDKFVTVKVYTTKQAEKAKLRLEFPAKYRCRTTGVWRVVVCRSENVKRYISPDITVISRNLRDLNLNAVSGCIYCVEDETVLYGKQMTAERKMASTTKVMTALLLCESGKIDGVTKISKRAANTEYANLHMKRGDKYNLRDLLYAMLLPSSNDAAAAIAEAVGGTQKDFVSLMNSRAQELGLTSTHYKNPHGLDAKGHYTSAYDLSRLMGFAYSFDDIKTVIAQSEYSFTSLRYGVTHNVKTTDMLKSLTKRHKGAKTGFTTPSGYCYTSIYVFRGKTYAVSLLGNRTVSDRKDDIKKLYRYIFKLSQTKY